MPLQAVTNLEFAEIVNTEALAGALDARSYGSATPFPHIVVEDFLRPSWFEALVGEFPDFRDRRWTNYSHVNERKRANTRYETWGPAAQRIGSALNCPAFLEWVEQLSGIDHLLADEAFEGGGLHQSIAGGYLNVHADFTVHPANRRWRRRVNLLLYCNPRWEQAWGGELELWSRDMSSCEKRIAPIANRAVLFSTDVDSFHGHPDPLTTPEGIARQSLAIYYFTEEANPLVRATEYRGRPGDGARKILIFADKQALRGFDWAKRHLGLSNDVATRLLGFVERLRGNRP